MLAVAMAAVAVAVAAVAVVVAAAAALEALNVAMVMVVAEAKAALTEDLGLGLLDDRGGDLHLGGRALHRSHVLREVPSEHLAHDIRTRLVGARDAVKGLGEGLRLQVLVPRELRRHRRAGGLGELGLLGRAEVLLLLHD